MKAKVLRRFRDRYTGELYKEGKVLNISKERFDEIQAVATLLEEVKEKKKTEKKDTEE